MGTEWTADSVLNAVVKQVLDVFGEESIVYDEPIREGLETPSFQVNQLDVAMHRKAYKTFELTEMFSVNYFPSDRLVSSNRAQELRAFRFKFLTEFRWLQDKYHVFRMNSSIVDGMLVSTFSVRHLVRDIDEGTLMQNLELGVSNDG